MGSDNSYGAIHRYEPARESSTAAIAIVLLTVIEIILVAMFVYGLANGWGVPDVWKTAVPSMLLGGILAAIFVDLAFILMLYRKEFLPDVMIVKKRRRKWEDLYIEEEDMHGTESFGGGWDHIKKAIYPYYKR